MRARSEGRWGVYDSRRHGPWSRRRACREAEPAGGADVITALALSPSIDVTYVIQAFRQGTINRPSAVHRVAGGKGLNVARAAHRIGADVAAVAVLGASSGTWIAEELARVGLPLHRVDGAEPTRTCVSIADEGRHTMTEIYEHAGRVTGAEWSALESAVAGALARRPGWLTISGSIPDGAPDGALGTLVELAHRADRRVAVDLHGRALGDALEAAPDLVKVNTEEAADALAADLSVTPQELAGLLAAQAKAGAVVTAGVDGAHGVSHRGSARHVRSARRGPYPVGSGDCLLAGLVAGLDGGQDVLEALVTASAVATANALVPGAARFDPAEVTMVLEEIEVR